MEHLVIDFRELERGKRLNNLYTLSCAHITIYKGNTHITTSFVVFAVCFNPVQTESM